MAFAQQALEDASGQPTLEAIVARGQAAFVSGDFARAERYFATATSVAPSDATAQYWRARALEALSGSAAAVSAYDFAQGLDPENVEIAWRRARAHLQRYGVDAALDKLERMPESGRRALYLGRFALLVAGRTSDADARAVWLARAGDYLAEARASMDGETALLLAEAGLEEASGNVASALSKLRDLAALAPDGLSEDGEPHATTLALAVLRMGDVDERAWEPEAALNEAVDLLQRGMALGPSGDAAQALGRLLYRRALAQDGAEDLERALDAFVRAADLSRDPDSQVLALNWLAATYQSLGHHENAAAAYLRALEIVPTDTTAATGLARMALILGRPEGAATGFRWAEAFGSEIWPGWVPEAELLAGDAQQALATLEDRMAAGDPTGQLRNLEGLARLIDGDATGALQVLRQTELTAWGRTGLVWALLSLGRFEDARREAWRYDLLGLFAEKVESGLAVELVLEGSPAHAAGLRPGDVIVEASDVSFAGQGAGADYKELFQSTTADDQSRVALTIRRGGTSMRLDVDLAGALER